MTEPSAAAPDPSPAGPGEAFRWRAFFGRSSDPVFALDRRRRLLFVNAAWERLTGVAADDALRLVCRRPRPGDPAEAAVAHALTPPAEVRHGEAARVRRSPPAGAAGRWWDIDFLPLRQPGDKTALLILGRITPVATDAAAVVAAPLPERLAALREQATRRYGPDLLIGEGPAFRRLAEQARLAGRTTAPVLLVGEPGTGKQTLARLIHYQGPNRERPFAALDCASLPAAPLADVLFGGPRLALGTIYLREPSHLPRELQQRLCEVLHATAEDDAAAPRILAGCGADPVEEVRAGRLLDDLYSALAVLTMHVPPLRERLADLPMLVDRLLERCNAEGEPPVKGLAADAWDVVRDYSWPGNLRELYAVLSAARRRTRTDHITAADLPAPLRLLRKIGETPGRRPERPLPLDALLEQAERRLIEMALQRARGKKNKAAEILAIWRTRLIRRMKALGLGGDEADAAGEGGE